MKNEKNYMGFRIPKIWQHFSGVFIEQKHISEETYTYMTLQKPITIFFYSSYTHKPKYNCKQNRLITFSNFPASAAAPFVLLTAAATPPNFRVCAQ